MGFPLVMYLSRSKTVALWPELGQTKARKIGFEGIKSSLSLSLNPKIDISAEWKKKPTSPAPNRTSSEPWPPYGSELIVIEIEKLLGTNKLIGSTSDFVRGDFLYIAYRLSGRLTISADQYPNRSFGGINLKIHGLNGRLIIAEINKEISVRLSLESIAGIDFDFRNSSWDVWESGAMHFFDEAANGGTAVTGLFTYEGKNDNSFATCGVVYFANTRMLEMEERDYPEVIKAIRYGLSA